MTDTTDVNGLTAVNDEEIVTTEITLEQCENMMSGMLEVISVRLQCCNQKNVATYLNSIWQHKKYVEMLTLIRVLVCHYKNGQTELSECFEQMADLVNSMVCELGLRNDPDYLVYSLEGALAYIPLCFRDDKLSNSDEITGLLHNNLKNALQQRNYYKMYGMLISFQTLFQSPDKTVIYDIYYEHLVALCPSLDDEPGSGGDETSDEATKD